MIRARNGQIVTVFIGILIFIVLVTIAIIFLFGRDDTPRVIIINDSTNISQYENLTDEYGCRVALGYSWCDIRQVCYRPWEESCNETNTSGANASMPFVNVTENYTENVTNTLMDLLNQYNDTLVNISLVNTILNMTCHSTNTYPDRNCTPGDILDVDMLIICRPGYATNARNVSDTLKDQVYQNYGINKSTGNTVIDHMIPLELGGSNSILNLWPESAIPYPGFYQKDNVENYLHDRVCDGTIPLSIAQYEINNNWASYINAATTKTDTNNNPTSGDFIG